jgi:hypothetical protein
MVRQDNGVPTRDAFWIMPVQKKSYGKVVVIRNQINVLKEFEQLLVAVQDDSNQVHIVCPAFFTQYPIHLVRSFYPNIIQHIATYVRNCFCPSLLTISYDSLDLYFY